MGKTLDELGDGVVDVPLPDPNRQIRRDARDAEVVMEEIQDLLTTGRASWATDTLEGIFETVRQSARVTEGQRKAVEKIRDAAERPRYPRRRW